MKPIAVQSKYDPAVSIRHAVLYGYDRIMAIWRNRKGRRPEMRKAIQAFRTLRDIDRATSEDYCDPECCNGLPGLPEEIAAARSLV